MNPMEWLGYWFGMALTFVLASIAVLSLVTVAVAVVVAPFFAIRSIRRWRRRSQAAALASEHGLLNAEILKGYVMYEENLRQAGKYRWEQPPGSPQVDPEGLPDYIRARLEPKVNPDYLRELDSTWLPRGPS